MVYGILYAGVDYNSLFLIVNSAVSYPVTAPTTRKKGWSREVLSYWLSTFDIFLLIPEPVFYVNISKKKEEGRGES
jgi:hypothetical protein